MLRFENIICYLIIVFVDLLLMTHYFSCLMHCNYNWLLCNVIATFWYSLKSTHRPSRKKYHLLFISSYLLSNNINMETPISSRHHYTLWFLWLKFLKIYSIHFFLYTPKFYLNPQSNLVAHWGFSIIHHWVYTKHNIHGRPMVYMFNVCLGAPCTQLLMTK